MVEIGPVNFLLSQTDSPILRFENAMSVAVKDVVRLAVAFMVSV